MKTALQKSSEGYTTVEEMLDIEDSCWALITLLWKLDVLKYDSSIGGDIDLERYGHQKELVEMWRDLYSRTFW
jgi:hypothetical protein